MSSMMVWNDTGWGFGNWLAMILVMVGFWGLLIALIVWLVRGVGGNRAPGRGSKGSVNIGADEILAERFARGEIDEDEFTRRLGLLHSTVDSSRSTRGA
jgi:putative membrane protein